LTNQPATANTHHVGASSRSIQPRCRRKADTPDAGTVPGVRATETRSKGLPPRLRKSRKAFNYLQNLPRDMAQPLLAERNLSVSSNASSSVCTPSYTSTLIFNLETRLEKPTAKCQSISGAPGISDVGNLEDSLRISTYHIKCHKTTSRGKATWIFLDAE